MPGRNPGLANDAHTRGKLGPFLLQNRIALGRRRLLVQRIDEDTASLTLAIPRHGKSCGSLTHTPSCGFVAVQRDTVTKADEMQFRWEVRAR
jgi:hypothetical protein